MEYPDFVNVYEQYNSEFLRPALPAVEGLFSEWKSKEFWVPAQPAEDPVIPTPVYNAYHRVKRAAATWDKLCRVQGEGSEITLASLDLLDDLLGIRLVIYLSNSYPVIHEALTRSDFIELHPDYRPRCYLPEAMIRRLGMPTSNFEMSDVKPSGYGSIHYTVRFRASTGLRLKRFELQVRTILLEAWGEIEHKLNYKSAVENEIGVRRQLRVIADSLRTVDEHFEIVHERSRYLRALNQAAGSMSDGDIIDDARLARLLAQHEIPASESELGKLRRILSSHRINTVGDFRIRTAGSAMGWIQEDLASRATGRHLDSFTLVAIVALLEPHPSRDDIRSSVLANIREVEITKNSPGRLFRPYRPN